MLSPPTPNVFTFSSSRKASSSLMQPPPRSLLGFPPPTAALGRGSPANKFPVWSSLLISATEASPVRSCHPSSISPPFKVSILATTRSTKVLYLKLETLPISLISTSLIPEFLVKSRWASLTLKSWYLWTSLGHLHCSSGSSLEAFQT